MAESTFGRRVGNDGKLVSRLRSGGRLTTQTLERIQSLISPARSKRGGSEPAQGGGWEGQQT